MMTYTIEQCTSPVQKDLEFFVQMAHDVNGKYGYKYDWGNFDVYGYALNHRIMICKKKGEHVGCFCSRLGPSVFDPKVRVLQQDLLYVKDDSRAAYLLMREFIDFGKRAADHIITMIGESTNIKPRSLERLGFSKLEELYRLEV